MLLLERAVKFSQRIPLIKFRFGTRNKIESKIEEPNKNKEPIKPEPLRTTALDILQLPERYRPRPISEEEINAINVYHFFKFFSFT